MRVDSGDIGRGVESEQDEQQFVHEPEHTQWDEEHLHQEYSEVDSRDLEERIEYLHALIGYKFHDLRRCLFELSCLVPNCLCRFGEYLSEVSDLRHFVFHQRGKLSGHRDESRMIMVDFWKKQVAVKKIGHER